MSLRHTSFRTKYALMVGMFTLLPFTVLAAAPTTVRDTAELFVAIMRGASRILFVSLTVGLSYGVVLYIINSDNENKREEIKGYLLWGVIGIIVAFGIWGLLAILSSSLGWGAVGIPLISPPH